MESKAGVEEKRVKSTIIRRRAKVETPTPEPEAAPAPAVVVDSPVVEEVKAATVAPVVPQEVATPAPQAPVTRVISTTPKTPITPVRTGNYISAPVLRTGLDKPKTTTPPPSSQAAKPAVARPGGVPGAPEEAPTEEEAAAAAAKDKARKPAKRKSRDELDMEMIERAGGLRRAAELMEFAPERLERVFKPDRNAKKKKKVVVREFKKTEITTPKAIKRVIRIEGAIRVSDLAHNMSVKASDVLKKLMALGMMANINQVVDADTALLVAQEFGYEVENVEFKESEFLENLHQNKTEDDESLASRPPIVTVMGHVDHGKTSLLDAIRSAQVAEGEAGGITQHIGAYEVKSSKGLITFVDTPGHEAFTAMRARGAQVTDIVILVVAADDGVMPQTVEAVHHAKAANVPLIVAVNKIDKPSADPGRVERGLMEHGLISEQLGGDTMFIKVSAKTKQGIDELLDMISLQAEVLDLKANPNKKAVGTVIEARLDKGRGPVATVIVQEGTLKVGDIVVAGTGMGKVRALLEYTGQQAKEAGPSKPVEILGLSEVPSAGDKFHVMNSEEEARELASHRSNKIKEQKQLQASQPVRLEDLYAKAAAGELPELRVIVKSDVQGSVEALKEILGKIPSDKAKVMVLHSGVGAITESDVMLAVASKAIIFGFHVRPDGKARDLAEREKIQIRSYNIIYEVVDEVKKAMAGLLKPTYQEKYLGRADVRQVFTVSKVGAIAGCGVTDGKIIRSASVRLLRDNAVIYTGKIGSLKRFKDDAKEVTLGMECGIGIENYNDVKAGDQIECFHVEEIAAQL